VSTKTSNIKV